jgi:hypothetical protein
MDATTEGHLKSVSQHYIRETIQNAIRSQADFSDFKPTLLIAASEDALTLARVLRDELKAVLGCESAIILTSVLQIYDDLNPYNVHLKEWKQT